MGGFGNKVTPSEELAAVIGTTEPLPRSEVVSRLWAYIHKHGLQDQENKRLIKPDTRLKIVFGGRESASMFEMSALVSKHLTTVK